MDSPELAIKLEKLKSKRDRLLHKLAKVERRIGNVDVVIDPSSGAEDDSGTPAGAGRRITSVKGLNLRLTELRMRDGLSQAQFAQRYGVPQTSISRWELGARPIPLPVILRIANTLPPAEKTIWMAFTGFEQAMPATRATQDADASAPLPGNGMPSEVQLATNFVGICTRVAKLTGKSSHHVLETAKGRRQSQQVVDAIVAEVRRMILEAGVDLG